MPSRTSTAPASISHRPGPISKRPPRVARAKPPLPTFVFRCLPGSEGQAVADTKLLQPDRHAVRPALGIDDREGKEATAARAGGRGGARPKATSTWPPVGP